MNEPYLGPKIKRWAAALALAALISHSSFLAAAHAQEAPPEEGHAPATVITGDAAAGAVTENSVNQSRTDGVCETDCPDNSPPLAVDNDNAATTTNEVGIVAATGGNQVATTAGDALIETGDIDILNIILNYINHNFLGYGREYFVNIFQKILGDVDLSGFGSTESDRQYGVCEGEGCLLIAQNDNRLALDNAVVIDADTGNNLIQGAGGGGTISTGDINIANDAVNVANLNIAGHNWFFAVINIFGELEGDIILPAIDGAGPAPETVLDDADLAGVTEELAQTEIGGRAHAADFVVYNSDLADAINDIRVSANTGDNLARSEEDLARIVTGKVLSQVHTFNLINFSFTGNDWRFARVNIFGNWDGFVQGLPAGFKVYEDENGRTVYNDYFLNPDAYPANVALEADNDNQASMTNGVTINANTGRNSVLSGHGADIATGDINIKNNSFNLLNGNFTGNDWQFSLVNVFGSWQGNLAFGKPDLWLAQSISTPAAVAKPDDYIFYRYAFGNRGDALAGNVRLTDDYDERLVLMDEPGGGRLENGRIVWDLGYLPPNSQGSISYRVRVWDRIDPGDYVLANQALIAAAEGDRNPADNSASGQVPVSVPSRASKSHLRNPAFDPVAGSGGTPVLAVIKSNNAAGELKPGDKVDFKVIIKNIGSAPLADVIAVDIMAGLKTNTQAGRDGWRIGDLAAGEGVEIGYTAEIAPHIPSDIYVNEVTVEGWDPAAGRYLDAFASSRIKVANDSPDETGRPLLNIAKIVRSSPAMPGGSLEVELVVTNNGQGKAKNVKLSDSLTNGLSFSGENGIMYKEWFLEDLNPGQFETLRYRLEIDSISLPGQYDSAATARADNHILVALNTVIQVKSQPALAASRPSNGRSVRPTASFLRVQPSPLSTEEKPTDGLVQTAYASAASAGDANGDDDQAIGLKPASASVLGASAAAAAPSNSGRWRQLAKTILWVDLLLIAYLLVVIVQRRYGLLPKTPKN